MNMTRGLYICCFLTLANLHCSGSEGGVFAQEEDVVDVVETGSDIIFYVPTTSSSSGDTSSPLPQDASDTETIDGDVDLDAALMADADAADGDIAQDSNEDTSATPDVPEPQDIAVEVAPYCPLGDYCDDKNPCTLLDECIEDNGCEGTPKNCDDENPCTVDLCNVETGECEHTNTTGEPCNNDVGICEDGVCLQICPDGTIGGCPVVHVGNLTISTTEELEAHQTTTHVEGNLILDLPEGIPTLPNLVNISGSLIIGETAGIKGFGMVGLESIGASLSFQNSETLYGFDLPNLKTIGNAVQAIGNDILVHLDLPVLEAVPSMTFTGNGQLQKLTFTKLEGPLTELVIKNNPLLPQCMAYLLKDQVLPASIDVAEGNCIECKCND